MSATGAEHRPHGLCWPVDYRRLQEGPAQGIQRLQLSPSTAVGQMHRPHPGEMQRINRTAAEAGQLPVLHRLGLNPGALAALPLVALPLVAVNQKDGGNHDTSNAGPRRVLCRRSRDRHRTDWRASAGYLRAASLAPTLGAARTMEGVCGSGADQEHSESDGSEDPEGLRPALLLDVQRPLLSRGERHQAASSHGIDSGIEEPDPCPGRIKPRRMVLDADRTDGGGGGDGRIGNCQER